MGRSFIGNTSRKKEKMVSYLNRNFSVRYRFLVTLAGMVTIGIFFVYQPMEKFGDVLPGPIAGRTMTWRARGQVYEDDDDVKRFVQLTKREVDYTKKVGGIGLTYKYPNTMLMTCPNHSTYAIYENFPYQNSYLNIAISAKDENGRRRPSGGDFWQVLIMQRERNASTVARVTDHLNGSYTALAYLPWAGLSEIRVTLIHPSDATHYLRYNYTNLKDRSAFIGTFKKGEKIEKTRCVVQHEGSWRNKCEYFHPTGLYSTRLLCDPPPTLPCDSLVMLPRSDDTNAMNSPMIPEDKKYLFTDERRYQIVHGGPKVIDIISSENQKTYKGPSSLPKCGPDLPQPPVDGYWLDGKYHSLVCDNSKEFTLADTMQCFSDIHLLLLGDSELRLLFYYIRRRLGSNAVMNKYTHSMHIYRKEMNFNVTFQFHPLFRHPEEGKSYVEDHRYEAEIMDSLDTTVTCNVVVVIGPWAHYALWTVAAYKERLEFLHDAVIRLKKRCPSAKIIMKGPQPTKTTTTFFDFICKNMMYEQRNLFSGHEVSYLNVWDMFDAAYWLEDPHPPDNAMASVLGLFQSYVC